MIGDKPTNSRLFSKRMMRYFIGLQAALTLLVATSGLAMADALSVGTIPTSPLSWNLATNPTDSPAMTIPITNGSTPQTATLFEWTMALEIVPANGATGTLSLATVSTPSNNVLNAGADSPTANYISSGGYYYTFASNNGPNYSSTVPTSGANMLSLQLSATSNASGTFNIYALPGSSADPLSFWTYYNQANNSDPDNGVNYAFTNIPFGTGTGTGVLLGSVLVTPAAVPEPGSMVLAAIAGLGYAGYGWRKRRRAASSEDADSEDVGHAPRA